MKKGLTKKLQYVIENIRLTLNELLELDFNQVRVHHINNDKLCYFDVSFNSTNINVHDPGRNDIFYGFELHKTYINLSKLSEDSDFMVRCPLILPCQLYDEYFERLQSHAMYTLLSRVEYYLDAAQTGSGIARQIKIEKTLAK